MLKIISGERINMSANSERISLTSRFPQLLFVTKGSVFINKERTDVRKGCFFSENTDISVKPDKDVPSAIARFEFDGDDTDSLLEAHGLLSQSVRFEANEQNTFAEFAELLCRTDYKNMKTDFGEGAARLLLSFIDVETTSDHSPEYANAYVDRAIRYIKAHYSEVLKVEELARLLGIDRMYLRNLFAEHVGMSTMEYIMNTRMTKAKELLGNDRLSVSDVASAVGYKDVLAFSKAFKKHVGVSPTEFRSGAKREEIRQSRQVPIFIL